ncbi:filamentous hemagglutinin [Izhakiella capsodis]|uniref:Filamentous hemagglutinin n=1 Tax=Izhakiella capsodis TaxID=1367852 RepID=A0A1I4ZQ58_9GAMM|nr:filamentous hemagglutinin N-terminal domain-containing protein [Izhakiella capsodis]SFN52119.1 filamentous hemagglutinin [Izhakiella capsodis]
MVVAEIAKACHCVVASVTPGQMLKTLTATLTPIGLALLLAASAVGLAQAGVVANSAAPGNQQPTIISNVNGTPQVNIQAPSATGVSHNRYSQFDVEQHGLILNNAHQNVQTQLDGRVAKKPWLAGAEARVIVNEVNSRDPSQLNGFIEVAGREAEVVIANPAGITCNGCGFINANRATLATGQPQMQNGQLTRYVIDRGEIAINGTGMDSSAQDYTDIIARTVKVNVRLSAQNLRITTGRNRVNVAHQKISSQQDDNPLTPQLALDVPSLGGMYAGKIRLIGTERDVGVSAGNITLSADGSNANSGAIYASDQLAIQSHNPLSYSRSLAAGGNLNASAASITSTSDSSLTAG